MLKKGGSEGNVTRNCIMGVQGGKKGLVKAQGGELAKEPVGVLVDWGLLKDTFQD